MVSAIEKPSEKSVSLGLKLFSIRSSWDFFNNREIIEECYLAGSDGLDFIYHFVPDFPWGKFQDMQSILGRRELGGACEPEEAAEEALFLEEEGIDGDNMAEAIIEFLLGFKTPTFEEVARQEGYTDAQIQYFLAAEYWPCPIPDL